MAFLLFWANIYGNGGGFSITAAGKDVFHAYWIYRNSGHSCCGADYTGARQAACVYEKIRAGCAGIQKYSSELTEDLKENVIAPLDEAQRPLREALEPLESLDKELKANVKDLESSIRDIGKAKPAEAPAADAPESPEPAPQAEAQRKLCLCPVTGIRHDFLLPGCGVCLQGIHALYSVLPDPRGRGQ